MAEHKLVMGEIVCIGPDGEEGIPYDDAVIHIEGDEDSEIRVNCPGALRLAPKIVKAVNNFEEAVRIIESLLGLELGSSERAMAFLAAVSTPSGGE
jgi:hypothetical protein